MANIKELKNKQKELISNLEEEDLKQYILFISNCLNESIIKNDVKQYEFNKELLEEVIETYKKDYANIIGFVYFSLFLNSSNYLKEMASDSEIEVGVPFKYNLYESEEDDEELTHNIRNILNKERIRARYNEKRTKETAE